MKVVVVLALLWLFVVKLFQKDRIPRTIQPHIVLIVADDMGWNDVGFHGSAQIPTPNIDALGYNGIILDRFYTQHICTPSRAALLTGNYPIRSGMQGSPLKAGENRSLPLDMQILPEFLKDLGYSTHLVGKWHLGAAYTNVTPTRRGFDSHFGYWNGFVGYFDYMSMQEMPDGGRFLGFDLHNFLTPAWSYVGQYATELFTEKSLEIIEYHDVDTPLFLMLAHLAAHTGQDGVELGVPNSSETNAKYPYIQDERRRLYADVVNQLDDSVGRVVKKLSDKGMLENSLIVFLSDNGAPTVGMYNNSGSNWPLKGIKATVLEGAVRGTAAIFSPLFKETGYVHRGLMHITDLLPTFYAAAGGNVLQLGNIDGMNQWDAFRENLPSSRIEVLVNIDEVELSSALIADKGQYKLVNGTSHHGQYDDYFGESGRGPEVPQYNIASVLTSPTNMAIQKLPLFPTLHEEKIQSLRSQVDLSWCRANQTALPTFVCTNFCLFDLDVDPCETTDIIQAKPQIAERLKMRLSYFYDQVVPQENKPVDFSSNPDYFNHTWYPWLDLASSVRSDDLSS